MGSNEPATNELVYILSPSYSGSTLLTLLLGSHPAIATVGELKTRVRRFGGAYRCSCGSDLEQCCLWKRVACKLEERGSALDVNDLGTRFECPDRPWLNRVLRARVRGTAFEILREGLVRGVPGCREQIARVARRNQRLIQAIAELMHGRIFLDSSKDPVRLHWLLRAGLWNIRVIHLTRDGRGTVFSSMRHEQIPMQRAAIDFRRTHREYRRLAPRFAAGSWTVLRYEDLCRDPRGSLGRVLAFLSLPDDGAVQLDFRAAEQHVFGNEMRLRSESEIRLDERWKTQLASGDLAIFERIAGATNRSLGYE